MTNTSDKYAGILFTKRLELPADFVDTRESILNGNITDAVVVNKVDPSYCRLKISDCRLADIVQFVEITRTALSLKVLKRSHDKLEHLGQCAI
jgi:hypothetical protein